MYLPHDLINTKAIYLLVFINVIFHFHVFVKVSQAGSVVCTVCTAGTYADHKANICVPCPANTYAKAQSDVCTPCPLDMYSALGDAKCSKCLKGYKLNAERTGCQLVNCNGGPTTSPPTRKPTCPRPTRPPTILPSCPSTRPLGKSLSS